MTIFHYFLIGLVIAVAIGVCVAICFWFSKPKHDYCSICDGECQE